MRSVLIVYHSMTGGTRQMAEAAAAGARSQGDLKVTLRQAAETGPAEVLGAVGYLFASPENLASMSGQMKDFFDRVYYPALDQLNGRPYAAMICAGSDGGNAAQQIVRIATGWRLKSIAEPLIICTHAQTPEQILQRKQITPGDLGRCQDLGATLAAGVAMGIF